VLGERKFPAVKPGLMAVGRVRGWREGSHAPSGAGEDSRDTLGLSRRDLFDT
jgi:hypothetical protein